jgi:hypothetical protein
MWCTTSASLRRSCARRSRRVVDVACKMACPARSTARRTLTRAPYPAGGCVSTNPPRAGLRRAGAQLLHLPSPLRTDCMPLSPGPTRAIYRGRRTCGLAGGWFEPLHACRRRLSKEVPSPLKTVSTPRAAPTPPRALTPTTPARSEGARGRKRQLLTLELLHCIPFPLPFHSHSTIPISVRRSCVRHRMSHALAAAAVAAAAAEAMPPSPTKAKQPRAATPPPAAATKPEPEPEPQSQPEGSLAGAPLTAFRPGRANGHWPSGRVATAA